jgi:hypothetical protein
MELGGEHTTTVSIITENVISSKHQFGTFLLLSSPIVPIQTSSLLQHAYRQPTSKDTVGNFRGSESNHGSKRNT